MVDLVYRNNGKYIIVCTLMCVRVCMPIWFRACVRTCMRGQRHIYEHNSCSRLHARQNIKA